MSADILSILSIPSCIVNAAMLVQVLQHASPAHLTSLTAALDGLGSRYAYDVDYLNGFIKWRVCLCLNLSCDNASYI